MKRSIKRLLLLGLAFALCLSAASVQAGEVLSLNPGDSTVREFVLFDEFNPRQLRPIESYFVLGSGDNDTKMGDLTITLKPTVTKDFGAILYYKLIGFVYALGSPLPTFINVRATAPNTLTKTVKMSAVYGFALLGTYIQSIDGDVNLPVQFNMTLSWAVAK